ncbi:hypothetical protein [Streptomyces sp. NPDC001286]
MLGLPADDDQQLVVHLPVEDASAAALDRLSGRRPGALRAVRPAVDTGVDESTTGPEQAHAVSRRRSAGSGRP